MRGPWSCGDCSRVATPLPRKHCHPEATLYSPLRLPPPTPLLRPSSGCSCGSDGISVGISPAPGIAALAPSFRQDTPKRVWVRVSKIRTPRFHSMSHSQAVTTPAQVHSLSVHGSGAEPTQAPGSRQWGAREEGGKGGEAPWGLGGTLRGGLYSRSSRPRRTQSGQLTPRGRLPHGPPDVHPNTILGAV